MIRFILKRDDPVALFLHVVATGKQPVERFGGTDNGERVFCEKVEEAIFAGKQFAEPSQHYKYIHPWIVMKLSYLTEALKKST
ncbi:hypothetical protein N183_29500 [Sinorhizobium sp. Sb3]|nr:hypothetical protein N183_29500 [Sinorhizobium sp. Sb3]